MLRAIDVVRQISPRALPAYAAAFDAGDAKLRAKGITTPLRLAHFLAQLAHETSSRTGAFTLERESGAYTAARIMEVFGVGVHSAAVTAQEAKRLAGNGPALFERVYGLGNPSKARELGNTKPGDGWKFRGNGLPQGTGRRFHKIASDETGVDFVNFPEQATSAEYALDFALCEWDATYNALADKNDIRAITRRLNGGYNGYEDRVRWFNKIYAILKKGEAPAWQSAKVSADTRQLQKGLVSLGYAIKVDGRYGPKTTEAVAAFQRANNIKVDGIAGDVTLAMIQARLSGLAANPTPAKAAVEVPQAVAAGGSTAGMGAAAQAFIDKSELLQPYATLSDWIGYVCAALVAAGVALALYGVVRSYIIPAFRKPKLAVPA